jgi:hypothetical protein
VKASGSASGVARRSPATAPKSASGQSPSPSAGGQGSLTSSARCDSSPPAAPDAETLDLWALIGDETGGEPKKWGDIMEAENAAKS